MLIAASMPTVGTAAPGCEPWVIALSGHDDPPLSRPITIHADRLTLKAALERLASSARLRLSYSAELLPLDRQVCLSYKDVALGAVLAHLLNGIAVQPIVAGRDHIVLAPKAERAHAATPDAQPIFPIEPIFATATAEAARQDRPSYGFSRLNHQQVSHYGNVGQALSAAVPGVWAWQSPAGFTTHYSVRGASFGASSPKVFIDGIEVANPLLVTQILPENIERIEVIRGPQGGALYGADAINGVTNIVTRHEIVSDGAPRLRVRSALAFSRSDYTGGAGVGQDHTVALRMGSQLRSAAFNLAMGSVGEYIPGSYARHLNFDGSLRLLTERTLITGTARFVNQTAGNPFGVLTDSAFQSSSLSMQQYTVGTRATIRQSDRFTHTLVLGVDGYSLGDLPNLRGKMLSTADSVLRAAGDGALRTTARVSTVLSLAAGSNATMAITFAAEHSNLHQYGNLSDAVSYTSKWAQTPAGSATDQVISQDSGSLIANEITTPFDQSRQSNGLLAQVDAALFGRASLTAGVRLEQDAINGVSVGTSTLPMLSGAYLIGNNALNARLRGAYGKAIRWPEMQRQPVPWLNQAPLRTVLAPEQQSGLEAGVDFTVGKTLELQITRFNQTATGLMRSVAVTSSYAFGGETYVRPGYAVQSVGEIANSGWELQGSVRRGTLALTGTMSTVESRVLRVAAGYTGDLRAGDRMLGVPARTASIEASWTGSAWSTSLAAARAFDWMDYDRAALAARQPGEVIGVQLRDYWLHYNGSTRLRATFARNLTRRFTLLLSGDNLLDKQTGEPDNLTFVPGRTVSFGVKASF